MNEKGAIDRAVTFLINQLPGPTLAEFVRQGHKAEITKAIKDIADYVRSQMGTHSTPPLSLRDRLILALYRNYANLITENYIEAGIAMAEHDGRKPVFYDPKTGSVYSLS